MSLARVIWSSHADLSGSGPHKLISPCQALIHRHSPLAAVSCSTLIISLRLASHASFSSPFKSLLCWSPLFSRSVESEFSMVWSQGSAEYTASPFPEHNCWSCGTGFLKLFCTCYEGYLVKSRRPLRFGSSQANHSAFNTEPALPLAAVTRSHVSNQPPSW